MPHKYSAAALLLLISLACSAAAQQPNARAILANVRMQQAQQELELQGQLRGGGKTVPFSLTMTGPVVRYSFTNPDEALQLRLGDKGSTLEEITPAGAMAVRGTDWTQRVRGTAITYEDLAFRFLYWPDAEVLGEDYINTRRVWKVEVRAPNRQTQYSRVFVWVEQQGGALLRMEGFDWANRTTKRFEVVSAQKIDGRWFLKQMRIEDVNPATGKVQTRTYLDIKK